MEEKQSLLKLILDGADGVMDEMAKQTPSQSGDTWPPTIIQGLFTEYWRKVYSAYQNGEPAAWINFGVPTELFYAMDIVPVEVDQIAASASSFGLAHKYNDLASEKVPEHLCSNNTVLLGAMLAGDVSPPTVMIHPANPCDSNLATYPAFSEYFDFDYFLIDMPYLTTERSIPYVANEFKKLIALLEEKTGRKLDLDKLRQVMEYSNVVHENALKLNELRETVPSPYSSQEVLLESGLLLNQVGTPELADYYKKRYKFVKAKVEKGEGHLTQEQEKLRLVWVYGAPVFDYGLYDWTEQAYGAVMVSNANNNFINEPVEDLSDLDSILNGLAQKLVLMPMTRECGGPFENYLDNSIDLIKRYKADAAIFGGNVACKSNWAVAKLLKDKVQEETGIPICNIEMDFFDDRIASLDAIKMQLGEYFSMMLQKKEGG